MGSIISLSSQPELERAYEDWLIFEGGHEIVFPLEDQGYRYVTLSFGEVPDLDLEHVLVVDEFPQATLILTKKIMSPRLIREYGMLVVGPDTIKEYRLRAIMDFYSDRPGPIIIGHPRREDWVAMVHKATRPGVEWQGSMFDEQGPFSHVESTTQEGAVYRLIDDYGFAGPDPEAMERVLGARANPSKGYTYALYHRPVSKFHVPEGYIEFGTHPDYPFGTVIYDHPLPPEKIAHWSLIEVSRSNEDIARVIANDMMEYAQEQIEDAEDDPRGFAIGVGYRIDDMKVHADRNVIAPMVLKLLKQSVSRSNPPYSGYDPHYPTRKMPKDPTKISYKTKRDALNVFIDWNASIIDEAFSGPSAKQPPDSFDNINHRYGLEGSRRVDNFAKALWWAMPAGSPYYLEDIDVEMLNQTSPMRHNTDRRLTIPDYAEEQRLLEKQRDYWESRHYADDEEVPF